MTPVTDPTILSQLNGNNPQAVTDPDILSQLNGSQNSSTGSAQQIGNVGVNYKNSGVLPMIARGTQDVLSGTLGGVANVGQSIANIPNAVANIPHMLGYGGQVNFPSPQNQMGGIQDFPKVFGIQNPNIADKLLQGAGQYAPFNPLSGITDVNNMAAALPQSIPIAQKITQYLMQSPKLSGALNQVVPGAAFGLTQDQANPIQGAAEGAGLGFAGAGIPSGIAALWSKIGANFQPNQYAKQLLNTLDVSGGNSLENNAKSLAQNIQNSFQTQKANASALYNPIFNNYGNSSIYNGVGIPTASYPNLDQNILDSFSPVLKKMNTEFTNNPTLDNAHDLQSQLGTYVRKYQLQDSKGNLDANSRNVMENYQNAQNSLSGDINSYLNTQQPGLGDQYNAATSYYASNVAPYLDNNTMASIAKGDTTYPKNIVSLFAKPNSSTQKIVQDLGPQANNQILYSLLGSPQNSASPENVINSFNNLDQKGLSSYMTPQIQQMRDTLASRIAYKNTALHAGGMAAGLLAARPLGGAGAEIVGGLMGNSILPPIIKGIQNVLPINAIGQGISSLSSNISPYLRQSLMANYLTGGNTNAP